MKKTPLASFKKMTTSLLLGGLFTGLTVSAAIDTQAGNKLLQPKPLAAASKANITQVVINAAGAIYVLRKNDSYYFWSINSAGDQLTLEEQVTVNFSQAQTINIHLAAGTEGLFYADNLIADPSTQISFKGQLTAGKIAIPLSKQAFMPLLDAAPNVQQSVTIDGNTPELLDTVAQQTDIYSTATTALADAQQLADDTLAIMADKQLSYKDRLLDEAAYADGLWQSYEQDKNQIDADFAAQINADVAHVEQATDQLQTQANQEVVQFEQRSLACLAALRGQIEKSTDQLGRNIEQFKTEFDEHPKLEAQISEVAARADQTAQNMAACVSQHGSLEQVNMDGIVDEVLYQQLGNRATQLEQQIDAEATQWQTDLQALPDELMHGLQTDELVLRTEAFESRFNQWISPVFLSKGAFIDNPYAAHKTTAEQQAADIQWLATMANKGQDQLCEDETFNISFNIGVVGVVIGTWWDDQIITGNEHNLVLALPGDDCVETHDGIDLVLGMPGRDRIFLGDHHDIAHGGWGTDEIHGSAGRSYSFNISGVEFEVNLGNLIMGGAGDDFLFGGETNADQGENFVVEPNGFTDIVLGDTLLFGQAFGNDFIDGEMGIDFLFGQRGDDTLINLGSGTITIASIGVQFGSYFFAAAGNDNITGSNTPLLLSSIGDFIFGADGNDTFNANNGRDFVFGSDGNDVGTGGGGNDFIFGSRGLDNLTGGDGIDLVFGGDDDDNVAGGNGPDLLFGNQGNDRVQGEGGPDLAFGNRGNDTVTGGDFSDLLFGGPGNDVVLGQNGWDLLFGNADRDNVSGNDGWDLIFGNRGTDQLFGNNGADVIFGNANDAEGDFEIINGGAGPDLMFGNAGREQIFGEDGLDVAFGNTGNDQIFGGNGLDLLFGNDGDDLINGNAGSDLLFGNDGDDTINGDDGVDLAFGNAGCDAMNGGNDPDIMFGNGNNDRLEGGGAADLLFGNAGLDEVLGQQGTDLLFGNDDRDLLDGGDQLDVMFAHAGNDFMVGGNGNDLMFGNTGNDFINGGNNTDLMFGGDNDDTLNGAGGNDLVFGQQNNDRINSGNDTDFTFGGDGNDRMRAVEGRNFAFGNQGNDTLDGFLPGAWDARDFLFGNQNNDNLTGNNNSQRDMRIGGAGADNRVWNTTWVTAAEFAGNWVNPGCQ